MKQIGEILKQTAAVTSRANTPTISNTDAAGEKEKGERKKAACSICGGLGFLRREVAVSSPDFGKLYPCICQLDDLQTQRAQELRQLSNLDNLARYTFDSFVPEGHSLNPEMRRNLRRAFELAHEFATKLQGWLIMVGNYGCGKTHLAAAIANERIAHGHPALFVNVPDLLDHLRATYSPNSPITYDQRFEIIRSTPLLILDDLGTENATPWAKEKLFQILNYRYNAQLPTVITTNHRLEEIDARLLSRMNDQNFCQIYTMQAPDFRGSGLMGQSGLSTLDLHREQTFESFDDREDLSAEERQNLRQAMDLAQEYVEQPRGWLLFTGDHGCGKTHLAAAISNYRLVQGYAVLFITVPDLLDHLRATFSPSSPVSYDRRFEELRTAPLLVLDDLGTHSATAWAKEKLYQLFNYRYAARLPTVITSSLTLDELEQQDSRLFSRLIDPARCTCSAILAAPYRGQATPNKHRGRRKR